MPTEPTICRECKGTGLSADGETACDECGGFRVGDHATWMYEARGGWGYVTPVPCVVVGGGYARKAIVAERSTGKLARRYVRVENLRPLQGSGRPFMSRPVSELLDETRPAR